MSNIRKDIKGKNVLIEGKEKSLQTIDSMDKEELGNCQNLKVKRGNKTNKENIIKGIIKPRNYKTIFKLFLILNVFIQITQQSSYIELIIEGGGERNVFCDATYLFKEDYYPDEVKK